VIKVLDEISEQRKQLMHVGHEALAAAGGTFYQFDLFAIGAVKRAVSVSAAFEQLVRMWNMVVARALLRMQIDTVARFGALRLVDSFEDFAGAVLGGTPINKIKDRDGKRMTDAHLVNELSKIAPWVERVYRYTCGYVHMSENFIFAPVHDMNDETRIMRFYISAEDRKFPDLSWLEACDCFRDTTEILSGQLRAWAEIKRQIRTELDNKAGD